MAVTYSNNFKFAIIENGTESGAWGTITNNNFQVALEQAIGGFSTVTFTTSTLTLTQDNQVTSTQPFRSLYLNCTGTPGAAATLIVPTIQKSYLVKNSVSGGFDVTVKTASGTGILIPNGRTALLYVDGTNVVTQQDYSSGLTIGGNATIGSTAVTAGTYQRLASNVLSPQIPGQIIVTSNGHGFSNGQILYLLFSAGTGGTATSGIYAISNVATNTFTVQDTITTASFIGSTSGASTTLSVTSVQSGTIQVGQIIAGTNIQAGTTITALGTGTGGVGTYTMSLASTGTVSGTITATYSGINPGAVVSITKYNNSFLLQSPITTFGSNGTAGQVLTSQGDGATPKWTSIPSPTGNISLSGNLTVAGNSTLNGNNTFGSTVTGITYTGYTKTASTITVNGTGFGVFSNGNVVYVVTSGGDAPSGLYTVSSASATSFVGTPTFSPFPTGITSGSVTSVTRYNGNQTFIGPVLAGYTPSAGTSGSILVSQGANSPPAWQFGIPALSSGGNNTLVSDNNSFTAVSSSTTTLYPASFNRVFANFNPRAVTGTATAEAPFGDLQTITGTYIWSNNGTSIGTAGTVLTVTSNAHGFRVGDIVWLRFTSGTAFNETYFWWYTINAVTTNNFTISTNGTGAGGAVWSLNTSGGCEYYIINPATLLPNAYTNVRRIVCGVYYNYNFAYRYMNEYAILFQTELPTVNYAWTGSTGANNSTAATSDQMYGNWISQPYRYSTSQKSFWKSTKYILVGSYLSYNNPTEQTPSDISIVITF